MPTLADVRKQHPEYSDLSDQQLADGLYRKFYSDMPRAEFDAKVGLKAAPQKAKPSTAKDVALSAAAGLTRGTAGVTDAFAASAVPGAPANILRSGLELVSKGVNRGAEELERRGVKLPDVQSATNALLAVTRGDHKPQTVAGQYADTIASFLPYSIGMGPRGAVSALGSGIGSETAGQATKGTKAEGAARLAGALVGGVPGAATRTPSAAAPVKNALAERAADFEKAGVPPSLAAMTKGGPAVAKVVAETPIAGARTRNALAAQVGAVEKSAESIGSKYGAAASRGAAGEAVQAGIADFNKRFSNRASKLYDQAFDDIDRGQAAAVERATQEAALRGGRLGGQTVTPKPVIEPSATAAALGSMGGRVNASPLSKIIVDPRVSRIASALESGAQDLRFGDLRALRTWVREAQANPELRQGIDQAGLQRLEAALTEDISTNAERLAGPAAARRLKQADTFYRLGSQRIQGALQSFVGKGEPKAGEAAYDLIIRAASDKGGADSARLTALKKSLKPEEWGDVAATTIDRMGAPNPGAAEQGFSIGNFVTNYNKLSPQGKGALFGSGELRRELDNLVSVAGDVKNIERAANTSNTATATRAGVMAATALNPKAWAPAAGVLASMALTGEVMTNPAAVRALAGLQKASARSPQALKEEIARLGQQAKKNATLLPLYEQVIAADLTNQKASGGSQR